MRELTHPTPSHPSADDAILLDVSRHALQHARHMCMLDDLDEAEDVAQDIVLEWLELLRAGTPPVVRTSLTTLVRTMVVRRLWQAKRLSDRTGNHDDEAAEGTIPAVNGWMRPDTAFELAELEAFIEKNTSALPAQTRRVVMLIQDDGATYRSVAQALGISPATVRDHLVLGRKRLRAAYAATFQESAPSVSLRAAAVLEAPTEAAA